GGPNALEYFDRQRPFLGGLRVVEDDLGIGDPDAILVAERVGAFDPVAVDVCAVGAVEIAYEISVLVMREPRVAPRGERVVDDDVVCAIAPEREYRFIPLNLRRARVLTSDHQERGRSRLHGALLQKPTSARGF